MRFRFTTLVLVCLAGFIAALAANQPARAEVMKTFYVSPKGDDANAGTEDAPFATITRARDAVREINNDMTGDIVVILDGGVYAISKPILFDHRDSGTGGHCVIYQSAPDEEAVISGAKRVTGWKKGDDDVWSAPAPVDNFRQLHVDGKRAVRARGGALPGAELYGQDGYKTTAVEMADWKNPEDIEFCYYVVWSHTRCKLKSIEREGDHAIVTMLQPHFTHAREKEGVHVTLPTYIENALELLDEPGEWYLDRPAKTVYYKPLAGQDVSKVEAVVPSVEKLVDLRGTLDDPIENIQFQGVTFADADWLLPSKIGFVNVQANFMLNWKNPMKRDQGFTAVHNEQIKSPANVVCHAAHGVRFERCTFTRLGGAGVDVEFGSQDNVISGCEFKDIAGSAIQIGDVTRDDHHPDDARKIVKDNSAVNNYIHDCCVEYLGGVGVFAGYTDGSVIAHNEITRLPYSGISVGWGWGEEDAGGGNPAYYMPFKYDTPTPSGDNRMEYNHIHGVMSRFNDGGGIYTLGNMKGTVIRGNHIHDNPGVPGGIYLDEGSGFIEITRNLVYDVSRAMNYNNRVQDRIATCNEHDNYFDVRPGGPERVAGKVGEAMKGGAIRAAHAEKLEPKHLTIEAWIRMSAYPDGEDPRRWIVNKNTHEFTDAHYALAIDGKKAAAYLNIGGGQENYHEALSGDVLKLNQWQHLAMTYDGSVLKVYVDGREVASKRIDKERTTGDKPLAIGEREDGYITFDGLIDEVRLYNRALSADEIKQDYEATGSADTRDEAGADGLVQVWTFDEPPTLSAEVEAIVENAGPAPQYRDLLER